MDRGMAATVVIIPHITADTIPRIMGATIPGITVATSTGGLTMATGTFTPRDTATTAVTVITAAGVAGNTARCLLLPDVLCYRTGRALNTQFAKFAEAYWIPGWNVI
jgi:hypothetical protein